MERIFGSTPRARPDSADAWVLGIDVGGTGSRAALEPLHRAGPVGRTVREGARVQVGGDRTGVVEVVEHLIESCLLERSDSPPAAVGIGATGAASLIGDHEAALQRLTRAAGGAPTVLAIDAVTAHLGALSGRGGAVVAVGTGAIAIGTDLRDRWLRVGGWGHLFDDRGSGAWIGIEALKAAIRTHDGVHVRGEAADAAALLDAATVRFGPVPTWPGELLTRHDRAGLLAGFARDVSRLAAAGDPVAADIMARAGREVAATLAAALGEGIPPRAAGTGGVFAAGGAFAAAFEHEFARLAPDAVLEPSAGTPLDGAVQLARLAATGELPTGHPPFLWSSRRA